MKKTRRISDRNRLVIPMIMLEGIKAKAGDLVNVEYDNKQIIITNPETETKRIKTKKEIERKLRNLNELVNEGFEDERLFGGIEMLEWILDTHREEFDYLNDYSDEVKEEDLSSSEEDS